MRKRTRRKVYPLINPVEYAITGAALIPQRELNNLRLRELAAIEAFRSGKAGLQDWHDVTALLNLCESMAREGIGAEALATCTQAQAALVEAAHRFQRTRRMGTTGTGLQAFRDLYEWHDLQRQAVERSAYERAIDKAIKRVNALNPTVLVIPQPALSSAP